MDTLYVKTTDIPVTKYRKSFIKQFLRGKVIPSYSDKSCVNLQCEGNKFRSVTEIYSMTLSRFPKTSFNAILKIIKELIDEDEKVTMVWCTQINKVVLKYLDESTKNYISKASRSNYYNSKGVDGFSLADYEEIIENLNK